MKLQYYEALNLWSVVMMAVDKKPVLLAGLCRSSAYPTSKSFSICMKLSNEVLQLDIIPPSYL